jgi:hypothetical protein
MVNRLSGWLLPQTFFDAKFFRPLIVLTTLLFLTSNSKMESAPQVSPMLRLERHNLATNHFSDFSCGYTKRWLANLRNPSFCRMNLCHGSCSHADRSPYASSIVGTPSLYREAGADPAPIENTPCQLATFHNLLQAGTPSCSHHQLPLAACPRQAE